MNFYIIGRTTEILASDVIEMDINESIKTFSGSNAGICYMSNCYFNSSVSGKENAIKRFNRTMKSGHHSVADHYNVTILMEEIPKMLAMILNSTQTYATSEKSARYMFDRKCMFRMKTANPYDLEELELELIDYGVEEIFEEENENEEKEIVLYGEFTAFNAIQKWIEENGYELVAAEFTRLPNVDLKVLEGDAKADVEKLIERIEEDDDVQNVYTTMQP